MLPIWKTWDFAQTFAFHDCTIFSLISWGSEAYYCALCVYVDEICLCLPYTFELEVVFCQAWQMVEVSTIMNSSKFKHSDLHLQEISILRPCPEVMAGFRALQANRPLGLSHCQEGFGDQAALRELCLHTLAAPQSIVFAAPSFLLLHAFQRLMAFESTMVMLLASFSCFSLLRVVLGWAKEIRLSQESPFEREIHRKPGNSGSGAHGTVSLYLKIKYVEKAKKQPGGDRQSCNDTIISAWSSVETAECKTSTNINTWFLTFYLTVLLGEHSRIIWERTLFSALITSNDF